MHARFRVTVSRSRVAIDRTKVALAIDQHVAQRKILRHTHHRVIDRRIAVRVIITQRMTNDFGRLLILRRRGQIEIAHRLQNTTMHRFQTIANVRQRAIYQHAHGVGQVAFLHLLFDQKVANARGLVGRHRGSVRGPGDYGSATVWASPGTWPRRVAAKAEQRLPATGYRPPDRAAKALGSETVKRNPRRSPTYWNPCGAACETLVI